MWKSVTTARKPLKRIRRENFDVVLLDLLMPEVDGMQVLESTKPFCPQTEFIILTAVDDIPTTVKAMRQGAYDYLVKPVDNELLFLSIERAYERKGLLAGLSVNASCETADIPPAFADTLTQSTQMKALISYAQVMARSGNPILITGESGTGKELMARGIHRAGPAPAGPFVAVNVSAIPATMFESQFFGHAKGAFTGADSGHQGFFEQADGGTLFLDEIGELPIGLQSKLLRVLEDKTFTPLGAEPSRSRGCPACFGHQYGAGPRLPGRPIPHRPVVPVEVRLYLPAAASGKKKRHSASCRRIFCRMPVSVTEKDFGFQSRGHECF